MWTLLDLFDVLIIATCAAFIWIVCPAEKLFPAILTIGAVVFMHMVARSALSAYGAGVEAPLIVAVAANIPAWAHLFFRLSIHGKITGLIFSSVIIWSGLASAGLIPIRIMSGPGFDYWTVLTVLLWLPVFAVSIGVWELRNGNRSTVSNR